MGNIKFSGAHCDEHGKILGGAAGDQTGREVCTKDAYMHSKGWVVLRHPDAAIAKKVAKFAKVLQKLQLRCNFFKRSSGTK